MAYIIQLILSSRRFHLLYNVVEESERSLLLLGCTLTIHFNAAEARASSS